MLEPEELKLLAKSVTTFENTKVNLEDDEKSFFVKLFEDCLSKTEKALGKIVPNSSEISNVTVEIINGGLLSETLNLESYFVEDIMLGQEFSSIIMEKVAAKKLSVLVTEEMDDSDELSEKEIATVNEVFDQMLGAFTKALMHNLKYETKFEIQSGKESTILEKENMLQLSFSLIVGNALDTTVYYLISYEAVNSMIKNILAASKDIKENKSEQIQDELEETVATVQPIRFEEFTDGSLAIEKENIDLLMDLQLQVSVELGKVKKPIKEILQFTQGTIVELDRLAGENVDVLVSGKVIAKGEVVVVDQNFGVRITQIVIPEKRV